jgi:hypothetical protein
MKTTTPGLATLARRVAPNLHVISISQPEPVLRRRNVVAVVPSTEEARATVLELEGIEDDDAAIGVVVMGSSPAPDSADSVDREGVTGAVAPRIVVGGLIGAIVGALVVAGAVALFADDSAIIAAALGGAALGGSIGAIWTVFARFGGSDAYRQTFVEPQVRDVTLVSYHTDRDEDARAGYERLHAHHDTVFILDQSGARVLRTSRS